MCLKGLHWKTYLVYLDNIIEMGRTLEIMAEALQHNNINDWPKIKSKEMYIILLQQMAYPRMRINMGSKGLAWSGTTV